jgi:hypothetical protein
MSGTRIKANSSCSRSILDRNGGTIQINSKEGRGTDVHVTIPLSSDGTGEILTPPTQSTAVADATLAMRIIRRRVAGKRVRALLSTRNIEFQHLDSLWSCIERYCSDWFGCHVLTGRKDKRKAADIIIRIVTRGLPKMTFPSLQTHLSLYSTKGYYFENSTSQKQHLFASACCPIGPFQTCSLHIEPARSRRAST